MEGTNKNQNECLNHKMSHESYMHGWIYTVMNKLEQNSKRKELTTLKLIMNDLIQFDRNKVK